MAADTFRSRVALLAQKSRKAIRLYDSMGKRNGGRGGAYADQQVVQWQEVNTELVRELNAILERPRTRRMVNDVFALCDRFYGQAHYAEAELETKHRDLIASSQNGDFTRCAQLSTELVKLKARMQATQAVYHELDDLLQKSKLSRPAPAQQELLLPDEGPAQRAAHEAILDSFGMSSFTEERPDESGEGADEEESTKAKVIQLKSRRRG